MDDKGSCDTLIKNGMDTIIKVSFGSCFTLHSISLFLIWTGSSLNNPKRKFVLGHAVVVLAAKSHVLASYSKTKTGTYDDNSS